MYHTSVAELEEVESWSPRFATKEIENNVIQAQGVAFKMDEMS